MTNKNKSQKIDKRETLRWVIEAIDRKAHYALKTGDTAAKLLKKWR